MGADAPSEVRVRPAGRGQQNGYELSQQTSGEPSEEHVSVDGITYADRESADGISSRTDPSGNLVSLSAPTCCYVSGLRTRQLQGD